MSICRSFERRAREEVERIKAEEAAQEERRQASMRDLAEQPSVQGALVVLSPGAHRPKTLPDLGSHEDLGALLAHQEDRA